MSNMRNLIVFAMVIAFIGGTSAMMGQYGQQQGMGQQGMGQQGMGQQGMGQHQMTQHQQKKAAKHERKAQKAANKGNMKKANKEQNKANQYKSGQRQ